MLYTYSYMAVLALPWIAELGARPYTGWHMADYTTIVELQNDAEARLLDAHLTELGIPHVLESYHDSAYVGIFQVQMGWGHIRAPEEYRESILEVYDDVVGGGTV